MPLERPPFVKVLAATMEMLVAADLGTVLADIIAELPVEDGAPPLEYKLRWLRNRYTTQEERPCTSLAFVSDAFQEAQQDGQYLSSGEAVRELAIDVITDIDLPTEVEVEELGTIADVAGLEILGHFDRRVVQVLKQACRSGAEPNPLNQKATWVQELGIDNDEDLADFPGRLVSRINVLYRVSTDDPMVLLAPGEG